MPPGEYQPKRDTVSMSGACERFSMSAAAVWDIVHAYKVQYARVGIQGVEIDFEQLTEAVRKAKRLRGK